MDYKRLGKRIKEERNKKNLTQEQLAEAVGLSSVHISHIETGTTKPSIETLINICNAIGVTPDFVLIDSIYQSKEYMKDEFANLLKQCSEKDLKLLIDITKAIIENHSCEI